MFSGRSAGSFPKQRLVIEPNGTINYRKLYWKLEGRKGNLIKKRPLDLIKCDQIPLRSKTEYRMFYRLDLKRKLD